MVGDERDMPIESIINDNQRLPAENRRLSDLVRELGGNPDPNPDMP